VIAASILILHLFIAVFVGFRERKEGLSGIALGVAMVVLVFAIGWTLSTFLIRFIWPEAGIGLLIDNWADTATKRFLYREATSDSASLVLLTTAEAFFYAWYLRKDNGPHDKPTEGRTNGV
jgi:hypothetical protein